MTVAVIVLAVCVAGSLPLIAWLVYRIVGAAERTADERVAHTATNGKLERVSFELKNTADKLEHAEHTIEILAKESPDDPNVDLPPADTKSRIVRAAIKAKAAIARRAGATGAGAVEAVPPSSSTGAEATAEVLPAGSLDPEQPLL